MANANHKKKKNAKKDEFYTLYCDIQQEMNAYVEYNPDVFCDKILLFCSLIFYLWKILAFVVYDNEKMFNLKI